MSAYESTTPASMPPETWLVGVFDVPAPIKTCTEPPLSEIPIFDCTFPESIFGPAPVLPIVTVTSFLSLYETDMSVSFDNSSRSLSLKSSVELGELPKLEDNNLSFTPTS